MTDTIKNTKWRIHQIDKDICQYIFNDNDGTPNYDINITVLRNKDKALLIDTSFMHHATEIKSELETKGITVDKIVLSHYHPDHASGASHFSGVELICSKHYEENFKNCNDHWDKDHTYRKPTALIQTGDKWTYGPFTLEFLEAPGHCECSLITIVNDHFVHVGDLIMNDSTGKAMLPSVCADGSFKDHIASLNTVRNLNADMLLLSHGVPLEDKISIDRSIDTRLHYLHKVQTTNGQVEIEDTLIGGKTAWSFTNWHKSNLKNL